MTVAERELAPMWTPGLPVKFASTICWLWGMLLTLSGITVAIALVATDTWPSRPILALIVGAILCYTGYGLRKGHRLAAWTAVVVCGSFALLQLGNMTPAALLGMSSNLAVTIVVLITWPHFQPPSERVGA